MANPRRSKSAVALRANGEPPSGSEAPSAALDELREILFGAQLQSYDRRLARLEAQMDQLAEEMRAKMTGLERYVQNEVNTLIERLKHDAGSQGSLLADVIQKRHQETTQLISDGLREVRSASTDGALLSSLLVDVAKRLSSEAEGEPPGPPKS